MKKSYPKWKQNGLNIVQKTLTNQNADLPAKRGEMERIMNKKELVETMLKMADEAEYKGICKAEETGSAGEVEKERQAFYAECEELAKQNGYTIESVWEFFCKRHKAKMETVATAGIKDIRAKIGMSRREFHETFGVPERTLQNWEEGKRTPPDYVVNLLKMAVEKYLEEKENYDEIKEC